MSYVPPPPSGPGGGQEPLPQPLPGWIPGSELPGAAPPPSAPPYGQPPAAPQPYGQPPYGGQPYGQQPYGGQPFGGGGPSASQKKPSWLMPLLAVAVLAALGVVGFLVLGGDDDGGETSASAAAVRALDAALEGIEVDDTTNLAAIERCRGIDLGDVAAAAPASFDAETVLAAGEQADVARIGSRSRDPLVVECFAADQAVGAFAVYVGRAPSGDFEDFLDRVAGTTEQEAPVPFTGGTLHSNTTTDEFGNPAAQTIWTDGQAMVSLLVIGPDADVDLSEEWLRDALDGILAEAATLEAGDIEVVPAG